MKRFLHTLSVFFSTATGFFAKTDTLHKARFARVHELTSLFSHTLEEGASLLLGIAPLGGIYRVRATTARRELGHCLVVAPSRGGKGLLAVSQLLTWNHGSALVNDIKGELFDQTAGYRATLGNVYVIDPNGIGHRYDPLLARSTEKDMLSAATHLLHRPNEGEGKIFTERASIMLTYLLLASRLEEYPPFPYVRHLIHLGLPNAARRLNALSPHLATQFLDMEYDQANFADDRFLNSAWGTLSIRMRHLLTESVVRSLTGSDFTAGEILTAKKPVTVYLRLPEQDLVALSPLTRVLWQSFIGELITAYDRAPDKSICRPVLLLLDEAGVTEIPNLHLYAATVAGRGMSLFCAVQSLAQLDGIYGKYRADTIRNNMDTQIFYRQASMETAEYIERTLGKQSGFAHSQSTSPNDSARSGLSEQAVSLLTVQDIKQLRSNETICQHANYPPFKAARMDWRAFPLLRDRRAMAPPALSPLPALADSLPPVPWQRGNQWPHSPIDPDEMN